MNTWGSSRGRKTARTEGWKVGARLYAAPNPSGPLVRRCIFSARVDHDLLAMCAKDCALSSTTPEEELPGSGRILPIR